MKHTYIRNTRPERLLRGTKAKPKTEGFSDMDINEEQLADNHICLRQKKSWRPEEETHKPLSASCSRGKGACNNSGAIANPQLSPEEKLRISITSAPFAKDSRKPWQRRPRNVGTGNHQMKERPFTPPTDQRKGSLVKTYSSSIKVNGGPSYSSWKETTAPAFRPKTRPIPEFHPNVVGWRPSRGHPCSRQCNHQPQDFTFIIQPRLAGKENTVPPFRPCKRYIPEYHPEGKEWRPSRMHLCSKQCSHKRQDEDSETRRSSVKLIKGPQYYSVQHGEVTFKPLEPGHEHLLPPRNQVSKPMAPQGRFNEYIIDGHFHRFKQPELLTEHLAQFTDCKPWIRQGIFDEVTQASKENGFRATSVHPSITGHLYEDTTTLVNRSEPWSAGAGPNFKLHRSNQSSTASDAPLHIAKLS